MDTAAGVVVTADEICQAVELVLRQYLPALAAGAGLAPVEEWQQLPTAEALSTAQFPAIAVTTPGLADTPTRTGRGVNAVWRIAVGVYDRGGSHAQTAGNVRKWAALIRTVLLQDLAGDIVWQVTWVGEEYALRPEVSSARTLGGAAVAVDVAVHTATPLPPQVPHPCP